MSTERTNLPHHPRGILDIWIKVNKKGWKQADVAKDLGVSRQRVFQLLKKIQPTAKPEVFELRAYNEELRRVEVFHFSTKVRSPRLQRVA